MIRVQGTTGGAAPVALDGPDTTPYLFAQPIYLAAGWRGVMPVPPGKKYPVGITGLTGKTGGWPTDEDLIAWAEDRAEHGVYLRFPEDAVGVDVDAHSGKAGGASWAKLQAKHSPPPTWITTSRDDGVSGIRLYRAQLPDGRRWKEKKAGDNIELLHFGHRGAMVWPSLHPVIGARYRWLDPSGVDPVDTVPRLDDLPWMPDAMILDLTEPIGRTKPKEQAQAKEPVQAKVEGRLAMASSRTPFTVDQARDHIESKALAPLRAAQDGGINNQLNDSAMVFGHFVPGLLTEEQAIANLTEALESTVYDGATWQAEDTIASGLRAGMADPYVVEEESVQSSSDTPGPLSSSATPAGIPPDLVPHPWKKGSFVPPGRAEQLRKEGDPNRRKLRVQRASEIRARATRWLWAETRDQAPASWLPLGGLVLLAGREGVGKSTIAYEVAAKITRGSLPGAFYGTPRSVVISATEDAWEQTVVPRLMAADADLDRVMRVDAETPKGLPEAIKLPDDLDALDELIRDEDVALVLLDPLMGTISSALDSHRDHDIRLALEPVARLASTSQVTVLGLIHENKSGAADLVNRIMASRAFAAVARGVLYAARDDELVKDQDRVKLVGPERFLFGQVKNNLARRVPFTLRYHIDGHVVGRDEELDEDIWSSRITWDGIVTEGLQEIVRRQEHDAKTIAKDTAQGRAGRWLEDYLAGKPDGIPYVELNLDATRAGHNYRTLRRAAADVGVHIEGGRQSVWRLPDSLLVPVVPDVPDVLDGPDVPEIEDNGDNGDGDKDTRSLSATDGEVVTT